MAWLPSGQHFLVRFVKALDALAGAEAESALDFTTTPDYLKSRMSDVEMKLIAASCIHIQLAGNDSVTFPSGPQTRSVSWISSLYKWRSQRCKLFWKEEKPTQS